jgi:hypothetical protein
LRLVYSKRSVVGLWLCGAERPEVLFKVAGAVSAEPFAEVMGLTEGFHSGRCRVPVVGVGVGDRDVDSAPSVMPAVELVRSLGFDEDCSAVRGAQQRVLERPVIAGARCG